MKLRSAGLTVELPPGFEARVRKQDPSRPGRQGNAGLHAATVPLPADRGDFGSGAVDALGPDDVFFSLFEYDREEAGTALYAAQGLPRIRPSDFDPNAMQRPLPGQSGGQWFFTVNGRPFCLFVVLGSHARRAAGARRVSDLLAGLDISGVS